jgi:hypothetical protein
MTETEYTPNSDSVECTLEEVSEAILFSLLLPPEEKSQLGDALESAGEKARLYGETSEVSAPLGERAIKIAICANELLTAMGGDVLSAARDGDWGPLRADLAQIAQRAANYGYALLGNEVFDFLLEVFDGKKRPKRRPTSSRIAVRNRAIIWFVITERERGINNDSSIENAAKKFNLGKRSIYGIASSKALDSERPILTLVRALQQEIDNLIVELDLLLRN